VFEFVQGNSYMCIAINALEVKKTDHCFMIILEEEEFPLNNIISVRDLNQVKMERNKLTHRRRRDTPDLDKFNKFKKKKFTPKYSKGGKKTMLIHGLITDVGKIMQWFSL